jgi:hypothetical protein
VKELDLFLAKAILALVDHAIHTANTAPVHDRQGDKSLDIPSFGTTGSRSVAFSSDLMRTPFRNAHP